MTLQEAHEIQRKELMSLRAENTRLKKQTSSLFPVEEKESLERHIRYLEQIIKTKDKRYDSARSYWKCTKNICSDLELEIISLKEELSTLQSENTSLRSRAETAENEVRMLNGTNKKLEKKLNTNFENSSLPSSALPFRKKVPNSRKPSGKKPGGQPGHKPHTASRLSPTKEPVHLPVPADFLNNPDLYPTGKTITKQVIDIQVVVNVTDYLSSEFSASTQAGKAKIFSLLTHSDVLYSDATVSNVNGTRKTVILCTDKEHVLYQHVDHKGHDGLVQTPVKNFVGTIVHDHDTHLTWNRQMHSLLQKMIHTAKQNKDGIPAEKVKLLTEKYESILVIATAEYLKYPPTKEYLDGYNLQKRLRDYQAEHLYFLSHPTVDYTNNISERGLRKFKRKQKQAVVLRSTSGGQHICDALTIIETARMQNKNVYDTVEIAFAK